MKKFTIIVAGGSGSRMKSIIPKQFIPINGIPLMAYTINQFQKVGCEIILVLPEDHHLTFKESVLSFCHSTEMILVTGGETRFHSVQNGLNAIQEEGVIAIHDAVRPFISTDLIEENFNSASEYGNAIVSVPLKDSIRKSIDHKNEARNRSDYRIIQTPQTFRSEQLFSAYKQSYSNLFTDDASVVEAAGYAIHLMDGDYKNIKVTTPEDLLIAKAFLNETI